MRLEEEISERAVQGGYPPGTVMLPGLTSAPARYSEACSSGQSMKRREGYRRRNFLRPHLHGMVKGMDADIPSRPLPKSLDATHGGTRSPNEYFGGTGRMKMHARIDKLLQSNGWFGSVARLAIMTFALIGIYACLLFLSVIHSMFFRKRLK